MSLLNAILLSAATGVPLRVNIGPVFNLRPPPTPQEIEEQEFKRALRKERKERQKQAEQERQARIAARAAERAKARPNSTQVGC